MNQNNPFNLDINRQSLAICAMSGLAIAFGVICFFVFGVDNPNPNWPANWRVRPLIVTPLAGAAGGLFFYFMKSLRFKSDAARLTAMLLGIFGYVVALWMGIVLGLVDTMWD